MDVQKGLKKECMGKLKSELLMLQLAMVDSVLTLIIFVDLTEAKYN